MEVLTLAGGRPPHEDVPMDLSTSSRRQLVLHHAPWPSLRDDHKHHVECVIDPVSTLSPEPIPPSPPPTARRYIPIPKKRHCHARTSPPSSTNSPPPKCQSPSVKICSPPSSMGWNVSNSISSEVSCKRARLESPKPSDLFGDSKFRLSSTEESSGPLTSNTISSSSSSSNSSSGGDEPSNKWRRLGAELARGDGDALVGGGEGLSQSVMRPRQRQHSPGAGTSSVGSPAGIPLTGSDGVPGRHLLNALLHLHTSTLSQGLLPTAALKDTEALLAAVHQSQMLYYTYCSHLIQNLRAKQLEQQQQQQQQRRQEQTHLDYQLEVEKQSPLEDIKSYEDEEEEKVDVAEEEQLSGLNSILRARLNSQETQPLSLDQRSSSAGSPCGTLPSSTTGGEDQDLSPSESCGGARKRAPRALTGKHVRPGTGASASTLLTLRQKLKERQKYRELYGGDPPQPAKTNKARPRKR
ncbi:uncharacterized protein [Panulirus ornatus]|uniref:uncharacterized protein n=1 Tax=Panulirus ornatus TaxID=150431 RepID=UPI003A86176F